MNPACNGTVNIKGILLIEQPNVVTFGRNVTLEGIIVRTAPSTFTGNYSSIEGVVAADGLYFSGNAGATIHGSLISYSANPTVVEGNVSLTFDRAGSTKIPAGFDTLRVLEYDAKSYAMN